MRTSHERSVSAFRVSAKKALANRDAHPLKLARIKKGITQHQLADLAHVSRAAVICAEAGRPMRSTTKAALAEIVGKW
jgi:DNA-binding XRE family transcriptional regulator